MTPVVGLDYSLKQIDCAVLDGKELAVTEHRLGSDAVSRANVVTRLAMDLQRLYGPVTAYVERPWMLHGEHANAQTTIKLSLLVGAIQGIFVASGHHVELVAPDAWRSAVLLRPYGRDRASKKRAAIRTVQLEHQRTCTDNQADAILIAKFGAATARRAQMVEAASALLTNQPENASTLNTPSLSSVGDKNRRSMPPAPPPIETLPDCTCPARWQRPRKA